MIIVLYYHITTVLEYYIHAAAFAGSGPFGLLAFESRSAVTGLVQACCRDIRKEDGNIWKLLHYVGFGVYWV